MAGTFGIFLAGYGLALSLLGLFAWPRRHALLYTFLALCMIAALITNIVLRSLRIAHCVPWIGLDSGSDDDSGIIAGDGDVDVGSDDDSGTVRKVYCGNRIATYITHGILIGILVR